MDNYQYNARDKICKLVKGSMAAASESAVANKLKESGFLPVSIKEAREGAISKFLDRFRRVKLSDLIMFFRQFATLQKAGVSIITTVNALRDQAANKALKDSLGQIASDVKAGQSLSSSLGKHPQIFDDLYINMVETGEEAGNLDQVLERLAVLCEHEQKVRLRIQAATRYPLIVISVMIIAFLILITMIVPRFAKIYSASGVSLPLPTLILIWINYTIQKFWWLALIMIGAFAFALNKFINTKKGRFWWDSLKLKIPVFGSLISKIIMSRFTRITSTLMHSGIPILRILQLASSGVGNMVIARTIDNIQMGVKEGKGMVEPMKISGLFPPVVIQMVSVGEDTGKMPELLLHVADYYDSQVDYIVENLTTLIEPILLLVLGCGVLLMALGIFLPMWNMMSLFTR